MRKIYILLKDSPELKRGAILKEKCDNGDQDFECINIKTHRKFKDEESISHSRNVVMKNPEWFQELKTVCLSENEIKKLKKLKIKIWPKETQ
jgi:hypothetical protein